MRQVAVLLERENDRLHATLTALMRELNQLRGDGASAAQRQIEALQEILAHREHALFGASADFAIEVAINKYGDHLPLERQARIMRREGLAIDSQTLWDQLEAAATILQPTYEALRRHVLAAPVIGAVETWWRLLQGPGAK